ncbi:MAG TPA: NADH-quinone oxidoreductase subunit M [Acidimicrobiales bacterium]|nr:NADH-quinone oxidoreductase subunit M [Acidimicrobiales bacterium]
MTHDNAFPFLTVLVLLPAGASVVSALVPGALGETRQRRLVYGVGLGATLATLALAVTVAVRYRAGDGGFRLVSQHVWAPSLGISWHLGVDGISVFLVLMTTLLFPLALVAGSVRHSPRSFVAWLLLLEAGCLGSFVALDLILFFLFFELTLVPVYFVIAGWGFAARAYAAIKFFVYTFLGSAFLLVGIVALAFIHQRQTGHLTFDLLALSTTHLGLASQVLLFCAFTAAFAVKAPVFPFHTWSPDAYAEAPTGGAVILAAVMAKLGTYGLIRFDLSLFPRAVVDLAPLLLTLGVIGILYGAVVACATRDLKRLVAYSSLAHLGFVVLGTFALTTQGVTGGVLQMVNHGLVIAVLFIVIGWIYERRRTWQTTELRGLQRPAPLLAAVFTVAMMAAVGLPGLNGFVGEFLVLLGTFLSHRWWAVVATAGVVLAAVYLLWAYQQAFHHEPDPETAKVRDLSWRELAVVAPLIGLIVFLGVYPKPVLDRITPSVDRIVGHVDAVTGKTPPPYGGATVSYQPVGGARAGARAGAPGPGGRP